MRFLKENFRADGRGFEAGTRRVQSHPTAASRRGKMSVKAPASLGVAEGSGSAWDEGGCAWVGVGGKRSLEAWVWDEGSTSRNISAGRHLYYAQLSPAQLRQPRLAQIRNVVFLGRTNTARHRLPQQKSWQKTRRAE